MILGETNYLEAGVIGLVASVVVTVLGLVAMRYVLLWLPADFFVEKPDHVPAWRKQHPAIVWTLLVFKNLLGLALLILGVTMIVTPGPGVMAILVGIALMDFPGKRRLEHWLLSQPHLRRKINRMREKAGRPPLQL